MWTDWLLIIMTVALFGLLGFDIWKVCGKHRRTKIVDEDESAEEED